MASETIHIRFSDKVDGSRELAAAAAGLAFDFATSYHDRPCGPRHGCGYQHAHHIWTAWWTMSRAVVIRCERKVSDAQR